MYSGNEISKAYEQVHNSRENEHHLNRQNKNHEIENINKFNIENARANPGNIIHENNRYNNNRENNRAKA